jgi:hypothetical protein
MCSGLLEGHLLVCEPIIRFQSHINQQTVCSQPTFYYWRNSQYRGRSWYYCLSVQLWTPLVVKICWKILSNKVEKRDKMNICKTGKYWEQRQIGQKSLTCRYFFTESVIIFRGLFSCHKPSFWWTVPTMLLTSNSTNEHMAPHM